MSLVAIIATAELGRSELAKLVGPDDELVVIVPAVEQTRLQWLANDEDAARAHAEEIGVEIGERAPTDASAVQARSEQPLQLIEDAIAEHHPDRIVIALRTGDEASWLEAGELERIPQAVQGVPVTHVQL